MPERFSWSACSHAGTLATRSVADELASLGAAGAEAEAVHDVVEALFEQAQQVLTRDAFLARRLLVVAAELLLEQAVVTTSLLLLAQLREVLALLDAPATVLPSPKARLVSVSFGS